MGAVDAHRGDERFCARIGREPFDDFVHARDREPGEESDAGRKRRFEIDFAPHRACGQLRHCRASPDQPREFVEALLRDNRRVHVRDQQALAPKGLRLDDRVDAGRRQAFFDLPGNRRDQRLWRRKEEIQRPALVEPARFDGRDARVRQSLCPQLRRKNHVGRGDKRRDMRQSGLWRRRL